MSVIFTCDLCGNQVAGTYGQYEGWYHDDMPTLEYWDEAVSPAGLGYHRFVLCNKYNDPDSCWLCVVHKEKLKWDGNRFIKPKK